MEKTTFPPITLNGVASNDTAEVWWVRQEKDGKTTQIPIRDAPDAILLQLIEALTKNVNEWRGLMSSGEATVGVCKYELDRRRRAVAVANFNDLQRLKQN